MGAFAYLGALIAGLVALAIAAFGAAIIVVMLTEETGPNEGPLRIGLSVIAVMFFGGLAWVAGLAARACWRRATHS
jgi:hypothetical protein